MYEPSHQLSLLDSRIHAGLCQLVCHGAPLEASEFGWYRGSVAKRATPAQVKAVAGVNFQVRFTNSETGGILPFRINPKSFTPPPKNAFVALGLTKDVWGANEKWVVLEKA